MQETGNVNNVNQKQLDSINALLKEVVSNNPFYKKKYSRFLHKISNGLKTQQDFFSLPYITKEEFLKDQRLNPPYGTNFSYPQERFLYIKSTSGTSGNPRLHAAFTQEDFQSRSFYCGNVLKKLTKIEPGEKMVIWMSTAPFAYMSSTQGAAGYKVFTLDGFEDCQEMIDKIRFFDITVLMSCATKVFLLMKFVRDNHIDPKSLPLKKVIVGSEGYMQNPTARKLVKKYLNAKCVSSAGSTESGQFLSQCSHDNLHLIDEGYIYEVINPETHKHGTKGELVITPFWRKGSSVIRYRTEDYVEIKDHPCPCGYPSSIIKPDSFGKLRDFYSINGHVFTSTNFDEYMRRYIGINSYYVKIFDNEIILKVEKTKLSKKTLNDLTLFLSNKFKIKINLKLIDDPKDESDKWKINRIFDARNKPKVALYLRILIRISNSLQVFLGKKKHLHPW